MSTITYILDSNPTTEDDKILRDGIVNFNREVVKEKATHFSIFAKDSNNIIGGALVWEHSDALYLDVLWCDENNRKHGIGSKIIQMIQSYARNKNLPKIFVDTFDFQSEAFYLKHGFYRIGVIPQYLLEHDRIYLRKDIF
ncbi:GNAT family N-acetyltransferase [Candidatus Berkiella aquae]|uniref:GNAT family N-acetyltransferase n=1 Tax=Candidatus Berkiella aquae TaxID=295108 RepID=A0A0Q9Z0X8_9GAMM|nr:GNAT family N-acetyltransferase [Candidatus Berkiella aquae]MCS5711927.1 GNAT family N-acetyltransferase [Candidatus Berkiella aquae]